MPLTKVQLMEAPGGPGVVGAVRSGTGISISTDGSISINPSSNITKIFGVGSVVTTGQTGIVTISGPAPTPGDPTFPAGTRTVFFQAAAPVGWTTITTNDNATIRLVSNTGGASGGSTAFTTAFITQQPTGSANYNSITWSGGSSSAANLSIAQIAAHTHTFAARGSPGPQSFVPEANAGSTALNPPITSSSAGSGSTHQHSVSGSLAGTDPVTLSSLNLTVRYLDLIICQRNAP